MLTGEYPPDMGGVGHYARHLAEAWTHSGHQVSVITTYTSRREDLADGIEVRQVADWHGAYVAVVAEEIARVRPDVLVVQYVPHLYGRGGVCLRTALSLGGLERRFGVPVGFVLHELYRPWSASPGGLAAPAAHRLQLRMLLRGAHAVIVTNPRHMAEVSARTTLQATLVPVGATIVPVAAASTRSTLRRSLGLPDTLVVAAFSPAGVNKRPRDLIAVLEQLPADAVLLWLGGLSQDDARTNRTFAEMGRRGVLERVRRVADRDDQAISNHLFAADIYLHTMEEGASSRSTTLAAALAHGLPIVAYRGRETPTFMKNGENILLARTGDIDDFVHVSVRLSGDPILRRSIGLGAVGAYKQWVAWDVVSRQILEAVA